LTFDDGSHIKAYATYAEFGTFERESWVKLDGTPVDKNIYGVQRGGWQGKEIPYEPFDMNEKERLTHD
jgi:hypothetical protein